MDTLGHETRRLFQFLRRHWLPQPDLDAGFLKSLDGFSKIQQQLRSSEKLNRLSREMYPDLERLMRDPEMRSDISESNRPLLEIEELHEILQIIQTMEVAWMNARMEDFDAHPLNRGWVAVFHRWAMMPSFRQTWPVLRADFSRAFIEYMESRFSLGVSYSELRDSHGRESPSDVASDGESVDTHQSGNSSRRTRRRGATLEGRSEDTSSFDLTTECAEVASRVIKKLREEFRGEWPEIDPAFLSDKNECLWYVVPQIAIEPGDGNPPSELSDVPLGFVTLLPPRHRKHLEGDNEALHSCDEQAPELRFWVRPQYRFLGVGRHLLNAFALKILELPPSRDLAQAFAPQGARVEGNYPHWNCKDELVTRYFVRTGQEGGRNLRRRMQLGFLYEYSFCRHDDRPYDERPRKELLQAVGGAPTHASEYGIDRGRTIDSQESLVPSILTTTWHRYFEASRAMSGSPVKFSDYVSQGDQS